MTVRDNDPDNAASSATQVFNGTHAIKVAAVADQPTFSSTAVGKEDQDIPVSITVNHPDNADGSERIQQVVINNVPGEFTLTESSALGGTLADNGGGTYTVTGASDAEIQDVLANLTLQLDAAPNTRTHVDDNFTLSVEVTIEENNPSETTSGQVARATWVETFNAPVTVHAVADAVTFSGSSVIVEDVMSATPVGQDITFTKIDQDGTEAVTEVTVSGFPAGATVVFNPVGGGPLQNFVSTGPAQVLTFNGGSEADIRSRRLDERPGSAALG